MDQAAHHLHDLNHLLSHSLQLGGRTDFPKRMRAWAKSIGATWNVPAAEAFRYIELG